MGKAWEGGTGKSTCPQHDSFYRVDEKYLFIAPPRPPPQGVDGVKRRGAAEGCSGGGEKGGEEQIDKIREPLTEVREKRMQNGVDTGTGNVELARTIDGAVYYKLPD